jgi:hypothetical protein
MCCELCEIKPRLKSKGIVKLNNPQKCMYTVNCIFCCEERFSRLKPKLFQIIFNNSVRTSKKARHFITTKINWLMMFKETSAVYPQSPHTI